MSNDAYDIKICHQLIWLNLVPRKASGPQHLHPLIQFLLKNHFNVIIEKPVKNFFPFMNFENPLYFWLKSINFEEGEWE